MAKNQAAWIKKAFGNPLKVEDAPYPSLGDDDIVIKSRAIAINPVDWKMQDMNMLVPSYPSIFGCDVAGTVEEVGRSVSGFTKGDRVVGQASCLVKGQQYGAFQHYVRCAANVACKIPDSMTFEQGCVMPLAINTAAIAFFQDNLLALPMPSNKPQASDKALFLYGGSTSVGSMAIQLAKAAGVFVVCTASASNVEHCKALGADEVVDYKPSDWIAQAVKKLDGREVVGAYDCISSPTTVKACFEVLAGTGSDGRVVIVGPLPDGSTAVPVFGATVTDYLELAKAIWQDFLPQALAEGTIVPKPDPQVVGTGLNFIQDAMNKQKKGVSARKLVVLLP